MTSASLRAGMMTAMRALCCDIAVGSVTGRQNPACAKNRYAQMMATKMDRMSSTRHYLYQHGLAIHSCYTRSLFMSSAEPTGLTKLELLLIAMVTLIGGALRFHHLGAQSLWMDEGATFQIVRLPLRDFADLIFRRELNMSAYYALLRVAPATLGSEAHLRFLSAVFGTLTIPAMWAYARKLLRPEGASFCAALIALNGFLIAYSQEARGYAMALFFLVITCALGIDLIRSGRHRVAWTVLCFVCFYSHFYSVLWLLPQVYVAVRANRGRGKEFFTPMLIVAAIGMVPLLIFVTKTRGGQLDWVPPLSLPRFVNSFYELAGYSMLGAVILFSAALVQAVLELLRPNDRGWKLTAAQFLIPFALLLAVSGLHPVWVPRFLIFAIPFLLLLAVRFMQDLRKLYAIPLTVVVLAAVSAHSTHGMPKQDWRAITASVCNNGSDAVAFWPGMARMPFEYYRANYPQCGAVLFPVSGPAITPRDFQAGKEQFSSQVCASSARDLTLLVDTTGQSKEKFDDVMARADRCYAEINSEKAGSIEISRWQRR